MGLLSESSTAMWNELRMLKHSSSRPSALGPCAASCGNSLTDRCQIQVMQPRQLRQCGEQHDMLQSQLISRNLAACMFFWHASCESGDVMKCASCVTLIA